MKHKDLLNYFIAWFAKKYTDARIIENHSGKARITKHKWIPYGMPPTGGGSDLMAFHTGGKTVFYEVKTNAYPKLSPDQHRWATLVTSLGFEYYVVREWEGPETFQVFSYEEYNKFMKKK
jgi:hypothetical protein